jgi:hypothetical protein
MERRLVQSDNKIPYPATGEVENPAGIRDDIAISQSPPVEQK